MGGRDGDRGRRDGEEGWREKEGNEKGEKRGSGIAERREGVAAVGSFQKKEGGNGLYIHCIWGYWGDLLWVNWRTTVSFNLYTKTKTHKLKHYFPPQCNIEETATLQYTEDGELLLTRGFWRWITRAGKVF